MRKLMMLMVTILALGMIAPSNAEIYRGMEYTISVPADLDIEYGYDGLQRIGTLELASITYRRNPTVSAVLWYRVSGSELVNIANENDTLPVNVYYTSTYSIDESTEEQTHTAGEMSIALYSCIVFNGELREKYYPATVYVEVPQSSWKQATKGATYNLKVRYNFYPVFDD